MGSGFYRSSSPKDLAPAEHSSAREGSSSQASAMSLQGNLKQRSNDSRAQNDPAEPNTWVIAWPSTLNVSADSLQPVHGLHPDFNLELREVTPDLMSIWTSSSELDSEMDTSVSCRTSEGEQNTHQQKTAKQETVEPTTRLYHPNSSRSDLVLPFGFTFFQDTYDKLVRKDKFPLPSAFIFERFVKKLLQHNDGLLLVDQMGRTPLMYASLLGYKDVVRLLLAHRADVQAKDVYIRTSLTYAAHAGHVPILHLLLDHGANVDGDGPILPRRRAVRDGHWSMVQLLLDHGAKVDGNEYHSPLSTAVRANHLPVIQLLLSRGANVDGNEPISPLERAIRHGRWSVVQLLLDYGAKVGGIDKGTATINSPDSDIDNLLAKAVFSGDRRVVRFLLDRGAWPDQANSRGISLLHHAVDFGHDRIVQLLLDDGAQPDLLDDFGRSPLHYAVILGREVITQVLLNYGAKPGVIDKLGMSPLHYAAELGRNAITQVLLGRGALPWVDLQTPGSSLPSLTTRSARLKSAIYLAAQDTSDLEKEKTSLEAQYLPRSPDTSQLSRETHLSALRASVDNNERGLPDAFDTPESMSENLKFAGDTRVNAISTPSHEETTRQVGLKRNAPNYGIPSGYTVEHWKPEERPILVIGCVFDYVSLGDWILQWASDANQHDGEEDRQRRIKAAAELRTAILDFFGFFKGVEDAYNLVKVSGDGQFLKYLVHSGEHEINELQKLLRRSEESMLQANDRSPTSQLDIRDGSDLVKALFGVHQQLELTRLYISSSRSWISRFREQCEGILAKLGVFDLGVQRAALLDDPTSDDSSLSDEPFEMLEDSHPFLHFLPSLRQRLLEEFKNWRCHGSDQTQKAISTATPDDVLTRSGPLLLQQAKRGKKRAEEADSGDESNGAGKRRKLDGKEESMLYLGCPYYKRDPFKHRHCLRYELKRIKDVKQHLCRRHVQPRFCAKCGQEFDSQSEQQNHTRNEECIRRDFIEPDGVNEDQKALLSSRVSRSMTQERQWYTIWDIVFPGIPYPPSVYVWDSVVESIVAFREFFQQHGPELIATRINSTALPYSMPNEERDLATLAQMAAVDVMTTLIDDLTGLTASENSSDPSLHPRTLMGAPIDQPSNTPRVSSQLGQPMLSTPGQEAPILPTASAVHHGGDLSLFQVPSEGEQPRHLQEFTSPSQFMTDYLNEQAAYGPTGDGLAMTPLAVEDEGDAIDGVISMEDFLQQSGEA